MKERKMNRDTYSSSNRYSSRACSYVTFILCRDRQRVDPGRDRPWGNFLDIH